MTIQERPDKKRKTAFGLAYLIDENPPWYICLLLGFQHYLTMLGGTLAIPFVLSGPMCFANNTLVISEILSTTFFVSSIATLLQTTFGVRLPIVQGGDFAYIAPTFAILSLPKWECPKLPEVNGNSTESSLIHDGEIWKSRMREIQGAIMVSSLFQFVLGITGLVGIFLRYIGPLSIAPTITLLGVGLVVEGAERAGNHWGISMTTIALIALFSQHLSNVKVPVPGYNKQKGGWYLGRYPVFRLFPVILAVVITWIICAIVTAAGGFPSDPSVPQYLARTDARTSVLKEAKWFRIPYPGQWGTPTVSFAGVFGILVGVLSVSVIESVGDYYACARLSGAPPPPIHAVNRGIWIEAIACLFAGAIGSGNGTTSYSQNIAAIGLTKVGSLRVIQWGALVLMVVGVLGKFGALFVTIPDPIIGGVLVVMFGMIAAVGISNLQFADMNSSRNLFVVGFSLVFGLSFPYYMSAHPNTINTGVKEIDQVITVVLSTNTALGCITALILDNTIPGTDEERGITAWRENLADKNSQFQTASIEVYDLPFCLKRLSYCKVAKYLPFLPYKGEVKLACNGEELQNGVLCNSEEHQNGVLCTRAETIGV